MWGPLLQDCWPLSGAGWSSAQPHPLSHHQEVKDHAAHPLAWIRTLAPTPRGCWTGTTVTLGPTCPTSIWPLYEQSSSALHPLSGAPGQARPTRTSTLLATETGSGAGRRPKQTQQDSLPAYSTPPLLLGVAKPGAGEHRLRSILDFREAAEIWEPWRGRKSPCPPSSPELGAGG